MTLVTGTPVGTITSQEDMVLEGAAYLYFQDAQAPEYNRPDSDGYYWNLATTGSFGVNLLGCVQGVNLGANMTVNALRCDNIGDRGEIQKLNHLEVSFTLKTPFPLAILTNILNGSPATHNAGQHTEKFGIGQPNNNQFWHVYMPKVYDDVAGDYVAFTIHRCQFVGNWKVEMKYGDAWTISGMTIQGFADTNLPTPQMFATVIRADASVL